MQATARTEGLGVPAKGVSGRGYEGHYFWDTEIYVVPFLCHTTPHWAKQVLEFRCGMLDAARTRAREIGHTGAAYPWRTINGSEASAWYAAGTAQYHINADIAYAMHQYNRVTGDLGFMLDQGAEVLVETARLWMRARLSLRAPRRALLHQRGHRSRRVHDRRRQQRLHQRDGEGAPRDRRARDRMAPGRRPRGARRARPRHGARPRREVDGLAPRGRELMHVPRNAQLGIVLQDEHFLERKRWDLEGTPAEKHPLLLHYHPLELYRHQVIKQTDVVLATYLAGHHFSDDEKRRTFDYYDPLTTGDSTLSACIQSVMASEVGYRRRRARLLPRRLHRRPARRARQHRRRHPHRVLRRHLARARRRLRRAARLRRRRVLPPPPAGRVGAPALPPPGARAADRGRHDARRDHLPPARRPRPPDRALRPAPQAHPRRGRSPSRRRRAPRPASPRTCRAPPDPTPEPLG